MSIAVITAQEFELPWSSTVEEDRRFKTWLKRLLALLLLFLIVVPWLPLPEIDREEVERIPPKLAKVILSKKPPAPPPPPSEIAKSESPKAEKVDKPSPKKQEEARKKVATMGVAAFSKELTSLRSSLDVAKLQARNTNVSTGAAVKTSRSVLGKTSAVATSGGVSTDALSANGQSLLAGHNSTAVSSPWGDGMGSDGTGGGSGKRGSTVNGGRDMESIRRIFEQHKGAIYALYNRELRKDPEIEGKFVFHIVIEPDGSISSIKLVSSELKHTRLEKRLLFRIQTISFGAEDVLATPVTYKFDFLPG